MEKYFLCNDWMCWCVLSSAGKMQKGKGFILTIRASFRNAWLQWWGPGLDQIKTIHTPGGPGVGWTQIHTQGQTLKCGNKHTSE